MDRRNFLAAAALAPTMINGTGAGMKNIFVHHVFFWLKDPQNNNDRDKLIAGLKKLAKIKAIKSYHIGIPAGTSRGVVDNSYSISWLTIFKDKAGHDSYQADPIHVEFVKSCESLWSRVVVYDSE